MIKMYLKIKDIFTRPNEFLPDMSGGQTDFREDCNAVNKYYRQYVRVHMTMPKWCVLQIVKVFMVHPQLKFSNVLLLQFMCTYAVHILIYSTV